MHIRVKINGLTPRQWTWLQQELKTSYQFAPWDVPVAVEFESGLEVRQTHMPVTEFAGLLTVMKSIQVKATAEALVAEAPGAGEDGELLASISEFPSREGPSEP